MGPHGASAKGGKGGNSGGRGGKGAAAALAEPQEDASTLIPCLITTEHPNGFVERGEPDKETHEVR